MLKLGKSKPWPEALEKLTGTRKMDVDPLKEYFDPLYKWMKKQREEKGYPLGWGEMPTAGSSTPKATQEPTSSVAVVVPTLFSIVGAMLMGLVYV